jgi:hypothetical protein
VSVTVVIATIPPRAVMLERAVASVAAQTVPAHILIAPDSGRTGSAETRNRALAEVITEWMLFLDDDDQLMPNAVQLLTEAQQDTGADVVSGAAWIPQRPGHAEPVTAPEPGWIAPEAVTARSVLHVTSLVQVSLAREAGGFTFRRDPGTGMMLDDYGFYCGLAAAGAQFWRIPETVLIWNVHGANTSGSPLRWLPLAQRPTWRAGHFGAFKEFRLAQRPENRRSVRFPGLARADPERHDHAAAVERELAQLVDDGVRVQHRRRVPAAGMRAVIDRLHERRRSREVLAFERPVDVDRPLEATHCMPRLVPAP